MEQKKGCLKISFQAARFIEVQLLLTVGVKDQVDSFQGILKMISCHGIPASSN